MRIKKENGEFYWHSAAFLWPYYYGSRFINTARRQWSKEASFTQILEGWYIGGWPAGDSKLPDQECSVLDCVCELPKKVHNKNYLNIPVWDTFGFTVEQLSKGAKWAADQRKAGRAVYVHCAYGHGRSCTMLSACLVEAGAFANFIEAFKHISSLRPRVYINKRQKGPLLEWSRLRGDELPTDLNTMPREKPPEVTEADLRK